MRSAKRMFFDFLFLSFHVAKWVVGIYFIIKVYQTAPTFFWFFVFLYLAAYVILDLYNVLKAIIKDTTLGDLDSEGEKSYVKGIPHEDLKMAKGQLFAFILVTTIGVVGIVNNVSQWKEDGQSRFGNIAISSLLIAGPAFVLIAQAKKKD